MNDKERIYKNLKPLIENITNKMFGSYQNDQYQIDIQCNNSKTFLDKLEPHNDLWAISVSLLHNKYPDHKSNVEKSINDLLQHIFDDIELNQLLDFAQCTQEQIKTNINNIIRVNDNAKNLFFSCYDGYEKPTNKSLVKIIQTQFVDNITDVVIHNLKLMSLHDNMLQKIYNDYCNAQVAIKSNDAEQLETAHCNTTVTEDDPYANASAPLEPINESLVSGDVVDNNYN